jgi:hypothetical protein
MIEINGLTGHQVALLDEMWACDTFEEYQEFLDQLSPEDQLECINLERMVLLAEMDNLVAEMPLTEAQKVLAQFRL